MNVPLTPDQRALIREGIADGRFENEEDAIQRALTLWEEYERRRLEILARLDQAEASVAAGKGRLITTREEARQFADDIKRRVTDRLNADPSTGR